MKQQSRMIRCALLLAMSLGLIACSHSASRHEDFQDHNPVVDMKKAASLHAQLAMEYMHAGNMQRAKDKINHAQKIAPHQADVHAVTGLYNEQVGEFEQADRAFTKAIHLDPRGAQYHQYADFLFRRGRYKEAMKYYQLVFKDTEYDNMANAYTSAGACALRDRQEKEAAAFFEKALNYDRYKTVALYEMARLTFAQEAYDSAMQYFERFEATVTPSKADLRFALEIAKALKDEQRIGRYQALLASSRS